MNCATAPQLYVLNERLFKFRLEKEPEFPFDYHGPQVDLYILKKHAHLLHQAMKELKVKEEKEQKRERKRKELIRRLNLELDAETLEKYGFLLR